LNGKESSSSKIAYKLPSVFSFLLRSEILGACLCQPPGLDFEAFMPLLLFVVEERGELVVCVSAVTQEGESSIGLTEVMTDALIEQGPYESFNFEPPSLAMGAYRNCNIEHQCIVVAVPENLTEVLLLLFPF